MGESEETILDIGCPSSDLASRLDRTLHSGVLHAHGSGATIDPKRPFLLVTYHPTTTEYGGETEQILNLLSALARVRVQTLMLWPNIDAGSDHISKSIRVFRNTEETGWLRLITNLMPEDYLKVLANSACAIGNSSSFVRDASFFGTPVVLVGQRQDGRERDRHVAPVMPVTDEIERAVRAQLAHGRYPPSKLYGDGGVSSRVAQRLVEIPLYVQKRLQYIHEPAPLAGQKRKAI
jgi:UDP-N-acetylglucosamine 2-epimerase